MGVFRSLSKGGGLKLFFFFPGEAQHPLGPENPLKLIDFTGPGGWLSPHSPPPEYVSVKMACAITIGPKIIDNLIDKDLHH